MLLISKFASCFLIKLMCVITISNAKTQISVDDPCNQIPVLGQLTGNFTFISSRTGIVYTYNPTVTYLDQQIHMVGMVTSSEFKKLTDVQLTFFGTCQAGALVLHTGFASAGDVQLNGNVDGNLVIASGKDVQSGDIIWSKY